MERVSYAAAQSVEAADRALLGSVRVGKDGGDDVVVPDFSRAKAADLQFLESYAEKPEPRDFAPFLQPGTTEWQDFFSLRKVVERVDEDGRRYASVTSAVVDHLDSPVRDTGKARSARPKQYDVAALLTDATLVERFRIKGSFRVAMRNLAAVDTLRAAARLQDHVRTFDGCERAVVSAGAYARSWKAARETVRLQAARFSAVSVTVKATFIGPKVFLYEGERDEGWRVFGPESVASLVRAVHTMVAGSSPQSVAFALGPELTLLDIDIHDGFDVMCPVRERHAGPHDEMAPVASPKVGAFLSPSGMQRLEALAQGCETVAVAGVNCATAVRVSGRYVLLNTHVLDESAEITCGGRVAKPVRMLSRDLWLARCDGADVAWPLREPDAGEEVLLCYKRHEDVQYGGPVVLRSCGGDVFSMGLDPCMRRGVSGAAVVAVSDLALIGVYDGTSLYSGLGAAFTPEMFTDINSFDESEAGSRVSVDLGDGLMGKMKSRGLGKFVQSALAALVPLYAHGQHVGMAFSTGGELCTTAGLTSSSLAVGESEGPVPTWSPSTAGLATADFGAVPPECAVHRAPVFGEEVFAVGRDAQGFYCSVKPGRVQHVGLAAKVFSVAGLEDGPLPFSGGLYVAVRDGAVVGVYDGVAADRKQVVTATGKAYPVRARAPVLVERAEAQLVRVFPFLAVSAWPEGVAAAVLTHASAGLENSKTMLAYAAIGDSALRTVLWERLLGEGLPTPRWQEVFQRSCSNAALGAKCEELGLARLLRMGHGAAAPGGSKVYADLLEAVVGAAYLHEKTENFRLLCGVVMGTYSAGAEAAPT